MKLDDLTPHVINIAEKSKETFNSMIDKLIAVCKEKQKASEEEVKPTTPPSPEKQPEKPKDENQV